MSFSLDEKQIVIWDKFHDGCEKLMTILIDLETLNKKGEYLVNRSIPEEMKD